MTVGSCDLQNCYADFMLDGVDKNLGVGDSEQGSAGNQSDFGHFHLRIRRLRDS